MLNSTSASVRQPYESMEQFILTYAMEAPCLAPGVRKLAAIYNCRKKLAIEDRESSASFLIRHFKISDCIHTAKEFFFLFFFFFALAVCAFRSVWELLCKVDFTVSCPSDRQLLGVTALSNGFCCYLKYA